MPFGMLGRTYPWMRQVVGLGIGQREEVSLGANVGRPIVTNGDFLLLGIPIAPLRRCCLLNS